MLLVSVLLPKVFLFFSLFFPPNYFLLEVLALIVDGEIVI